MTEHNLDRSVEIPLGFTFSFPCKQEGLDKARLVTWTKGFKCEGVEGEDIVRLLHEAAIRRVSNVQGRITWGVLLLADASDDSLQKSGNLKRIFLNMMTSVTKQFFNVLLQYEAPR